MSHRFLPVIIILSLLAIERAPAAAVLGFNQHIRPILSDRCFNCHGPDEKARKGKLRLDTSEGSRKALDDGWQVIKPGDVDHSELLRKINSPDPDEVMPPPESNLTLSAQEKSLLKQWVLEGAEYQGHWAFIPVPEKGAVPNSDFANPIDAFVAAELKTEGLRLAPEADRHTLIRRLSFDLTGLPPTPEEIKTFVRDTSPTAYDDLLARLLASPHYGEQMAVGWLDLARYADTYGYQADVDRDMSPWRDWVIRAFNENLPYNDFITWQIAGDLLPGATREQILATAFNRLHRQTNEGGSIDEEFRIEYVSDRVHTFGTAFLGLTLECARCHDHKFDPIKHTDYYSLSAFFNNIDESGLYSHFTRATPSPTLLLYNSENEKTEHGELKADIVLAEQRLKDLRNETLANTLELNRYTLRVSGLNQLKLPAPVAAFGFDDLDGKRSTNLVSTNAAEFADLDELAPGYTGQAVRFSGDNEVICKQSGQFNRAEEFTISLWVKPTEAQNRAVLFHFSRAWSDSGSRGYELVLDEGRPFFGLIHFWPGDAVAVRSVEKLPLNEWSHLTVTYDGSSKADGLRIYRNGIQVGTETIRDQLTRDITHRSEWGDSEVGNIHLTLGGRFRDSGFKNGVVDELLVFDQRLTGLEVYSAFQQLVDVNPGIFAAFVTRLVDGADQQASTEIALPDDWSPLVAEHILYRERAEAKQLVSDLKAMRVKENALANAVPEIMVMRDMPGQRPTYLLNRGAYDAPKERVQPDTPAGVMPFPPDAPRNRLGLAAWLTDRKNPLASRVEVNRIWKQHFGHGLVATVEDFGSQGARPTHPQLLDYLAAWFMDNDWNVKALHGLICTSQTYRQSSKAAPELMARDPRNELLARGPMHRLSAEQIRDESLAASGLLVGKIGGPSVKPYQPAGLWEESGTGKSYKTDTGDKLYRRSLYTFWRRTSPPPSMLTFDATSREVCIAKREITSTPLQSLVLMNDPQFIEAARILAQRLLLKHKGNGEACLPDALLGLIGREPTAAETNLLNSLLNGQLQVYTQDPDATKKVLSIGEKPVAEGVSEPDLAALTMVINTLMNYDEFVMKR